MVIVPLVCKGNKCSPAAVPTGRLCLGLRAEDVAGVESDTRWQCRSSLAIPSPAYIQNYDVILFEPLYHMEQTFALPTSMWLQLDFQRSLIPLLPLSPAPVWLSLIHTKPHSVSVIKSKSGLFLQSRAETCSPSWPHIHQ